jgi:hypothetical protein
LDGCWSVLRLSGLLPPCVAKRIRGGQGVTLVAGIPLAGFRVEGTTLRYLLLPVEDELVPVSGDVWHGTGRLVGLTFCTFRLVRSQGRPAPRFDFPTRG